PFGNLDIDQSYFDVVRAGMSGVVNEPGGTAFPYRPTGVEWAMGGKSGSSQVYQISAEDRARGLTKQEELPWERRDHALFVSFAPFDNPRYACAVIVEHGIGGSRMAGGKTSAIMKAVMEKDPATRPAFDPRSLAQVNPQRQEG
ncbi:MAG: hypothetical protein KC468_04695, partial [Myxococcales bacterium]|nr:hypothetical protein [Myxococcales bacterium]